MFTCYRDMSQKFNSALQGLRFLEERIKMLRFSIIFKQYIIQKPSHYRIHHSVLPLSLYMITKYHFILLKLIIP